MEPEAESTSLNNYTVQDLINDINFLSSLPKRMYTCRICKIPFSKKADVIQHEKIHAIKQFRCFQCKKIFRNMLALKEHFYSYHEKAVKYICTICSKIFTQYANYYKHSKEHELSKCFICDEKFPDYVTLYEHSMIVHPHEMALYEQSHNNTSK